MPSDGQHLKPYWWKQGQTGNPKGRPKKYRIFEQLKKKVPELEEVQKIRKQDVYDVYEYILSMDDEQIRSVLKNPKVSKLIKLVIIILDRIEAKGDVVSFEAVLSRLYGKPKVEVEGTLDVNVDFPLLEHEANVQSD